MLALEIHCLGEGLRPPGAYLDLRGNQLPGGRLGQQLVLKAGYMHVVEAVTQVEAIRIDDRELLLEADREIRRGLEQLPRSRQVEVARVLGVVRAAAAHQDPRTSPSIKSLFGARCSRLTLCVRSGRSRARKGDRPLGWTCARSRLAAPGAAAPSS